MPELTQPIGDVTVPREPVHELVREMARVIPDSVAVTGMDAEVTYRDLDDAAESLRQSLEQYGCTAGDSVGVCVAPGPAHVTALLGVLRSGASVVCLNPEDESDRARAALADVGAQWLVSQDGQFTVERLKETRDRENSNIAYIAYTSGSTGRPKGIAQSHESLAQFVTWMSAEFAIDQHARVAQWAVPSYDASLCEVFMTLTAGARLYPIAGRARINPDTLLSWLEQNAITHLQTVPSFAKELVAAVRRRRRPVNLPSLTHVLLAGEVLSGELAASLRKVVPTARIINLYGPTESILATWHEVDSGQPGTVPVGKAIPGRTVVVADQQDERCLPGEPGEIVVISPFAATGYLGVRQDESAFRSLRGDTTGVPTYRTGDRGRYLPDGTIEFLGRRDSQIKILGKRLELAEVEAALADEPSIQHSVVIAIPGADGLVTRLVAFVMPADGERHPRLARRCRDRLREWFGSTGVPVSVRPIDRLPRTATGKVDRKRLADLATGTSEADDRM